MIISYHCGIFILYATVCNLLRKLQISEDVPSLLGLVHRYCAGTKLVLASGTICKGNQKEFLDSWINKQTYRYTVYIWLFRFYICSYGSDSEKDYCCNIANNSSLYQGENSITIRLSHYLGSSTIVAVLITLHVYNTNYHTWCKQCQMILPTAFGGLLIHWHWTVTPPPQCQGHFWLLLKSQYAPQVTSGADQTHTCSL